MYIIIDKQTGNVISKIYKNFLRARHRADRLDNEYGAYRYIVKKI